MTTTQSKRVGAVRRRRMPGQGRLLGAAGLLVVGAFMPWLMTGVGMISGLVGAGVWTFYASMLALAGGLVPHRGLAAAQGVVVGVVVVGIGVWQLVHTVQLLGTSGWSPGPGLVLTIGGGGLALAGGLQLLQGRREAADG